VNLVIPNGSQIITRIPGIYRVVYSVTTTAAAPGVFLQLIQNNGLVATSPIPIQEGVNVNEIFLALSPSAALKLDLSGTVDLVSGKNASVLLELVTLA
jgi:hypothetical protein